MPKKANRRPVRTKARQRPRTQPPRRATPVAEEESLNGSAAAVAAEPVPRPATVSASTAAQQRARRPTAARRPAPVATINYSYLRRDLTILGVLAPSMVILVVVAFLVFH